jgi:ribosomal protein L40E
MWPSIEICEIIPFSCVQNSEFVLKLDARMLVGRRAKKILAAILLFGRQVGCPAPTKVLNGSSNTSSGLCWTCGPQVFPVKEVCRKCAVRLASVRANTSSKCFRTGKRLKCQHDTRGFWPMRSINSSTVACDKTIRWRERLIMM